ncbi:hypothetical protein GKE82_23180 [Conexibacter sp. W3-3-2]|uniref:hypothetical protein n=1 Tax=Conexibacter sp. W3-3-2 TaxID=2675227 RepID=UPI0012B6E5CA|nr:hypothetical protein [Conexibacter sp. W3-3-2]MTD47110.1 hypothetical protein [Conexibacter sp. W3-3-2]
MRVARSRELVAQGRPAALVARVAGISRQAIYRRPTRPPVAQPGGGAAVGDPQQPVVLGERERADGVLVGGLDRLDALDARVELERVGEPANCGHPRRQRRRRQAAACEVIPERHDEVAVDRGRGDEMPPARTTAKSASWR